MANARSAVGPAIECTNCGYELRGCSVTGRCPECGTPVAESLHLPYMTRWGANDLTPAPDVVLGVSGLLRFLLRIVLPVLGLIVGTFVFLYVAIRFFGR